MKFNGWTNEAEKGDKVSAYGITVTIDKLYYSDYDNGVWDIEFTDTTGHYRHWKQCYDGGEFIPQ